MKFLPILCLCLSSCVQLQYEATTKQGTEKFAYNSFGGSGALDSAGGTRLTHNHNKTAGQFFQTVATVAGSVAAAYTANSDNTAATAQALNASRAATAQQKIAADAAAAQTAAKGAATSEAIKAGAPLNPITVNPP